MSKKHKRAHVITGLGDGGAEAALYRLCANSSNPASQVVISLSGTEKYSALLVEAGVEVYHLNMARGRISIRALWKLYSIIRFIQPTVVQTWMYHSDLLGGVVARIAGSKRVFWNIRHTELVPGATGRSTRIVARICAGLSRVVPTRIVACAERARTVHIALGYDAEKFVVIPNGCDVTAFVPDAEAGAAQRLQLALPADGPVIGLIGRWNPQKDHANLIAAFDSVLVHYPAARLVLVGTDCTPHNPALVSLLEGSGVSGRVHLLGRRDDIPAVMNGLDLHILSSSHGEAFPNVVAEAMACGTPCVVTDVGDAGMIVGETGWVVPPQDSEALAAAIVSALTEKERQPENWSVRKHSARQRIVDKFSLAAMVQAYETLWRSPGDNATS